MVKLTLRKAGLGRTWGYRTKPLAFLCKKFEELVQSSRTSAVTTPTAITPVANSIVPSDEGVSLSPDAIRGVVLVTTGALCFCVDDVVFQLPYPGMLNVGVLVGNAEWPRYPGLQDPLELKPQSSSIESKLLAAVIEIPLTGGFIEIKGYGQPAMLSLTLDPGLYDVQARYYERSPDGVDIVVRVVRRPIKIDSSTVLDRVV